MCLKHEAPEGMGFKGLVYADGGELCVGPGSGVVAILKGPVALEKVSLLMLNEVSS